jgi:hypothetical protein
MPTSNNTPAASTTQPQAKDFQEAFDRVEAEIRALPESALIPVNLDVPSAVATALGALPEILAFRERLTALKDVDTTRLDKLRDYGFALLHTQTAYRGATGPADPIGGMAEELFAIRDQLFSDAQTLGKRKLLDLTRVEKYRSGLGFKNLALDVNGLVQILRENAGAIAGKTAVTAAELDHAAELAGTIIVAVGVKEQSPAVTSAITLVRQQAFTLFVNAYDALRRGISFLRWNEGDVDTIAPSLYAGRTGRKPTEPDATDPTTPASATTPTSANNPTSPITAPAQAGANKPAATNSASDVSTLPGIGLPGSAPFTH